VFRDMSVKQAGLTNKEYMRLKRQLSERIINHIFHDRREKEMC